MELINGSFYLFFQNTTEVNGFKGFVGYGLRELDLNETNFYCTDTKYRSEILLTQTRVNFTTDFMIRSYSSGCYYYDLDTGKWSSYGMQINEDSNTEQTHCSSSHLTLFAGGLVFTPSTINFKYYYTNTSLNQNRTIFLVVLLFAFLYIFFAIWSWFKDRRDKKKLGVYWLTDNFPNDSYFYQLFVFTGTKSESETKSKVNYF